MNKFIKNFFAFLILSLGFFTFSGVSKAEACEIVASGTNLRPAGWFTVNQYSDSAPPYVYFDIKTIKI